MKKILALVLSLILSLSSIGAVADEGFTAKLDFEIAFDQLMTLAAAEMDEETAAAAQMILPLLNKMDLQVVAADEQVQLSLAANNMPIASLALGMQENQIVIVSDLFPSYCLTLSLETVEALLTEAASAMPQIDAATEEAMEDALEDFGEKLALQLHNYIGQLETGNFVVDGEKFTAKIPVNITLEEMAVLIMTLVKDLAAEPALANLFAMLDVEITGLDEAIAQMQQDAKTNPHPCDLAVYSRPDANGELGEDLAITFATSEDDMLIALSALILEEEVCGYMVVGDSSHTSFDAMYEAAMSGMEEAAVIEWSLAEGEDDSFYMGLAVCVMGMYMSLEADGAETKDGFVLNTAFNFPTPDTALLTSTVSLQEGGTITLPVTTAGKTAITAEELMNDPYAAEEKLEGLLMDVQTYGLPVLLANLISAMPNEASTLLTQIMLLQQGQELPATHETAAPYTVPATNAPAPTAEPEKNNGGSFMDILRTTAAPEATETPAPTQVPVNPGFFGKPNN